MNDNYFVVLSLFIFRWPDVYKIGLTERILLNIDVVNTGENAYDTKCLIQLPIGVEYVSSNSSSTVRLSYQLVDFY